MEFPCGLFQPKSAGRRRPPDDAQSNGNFDEVDVAVANDQNGAVHIFECRDGGGSRQVPQSNMPSFDPAREEAIRCAIDLLVDLDPGTDALAGWLVRVRDANGELLCAIDVQDAEVARQVWQRCIHP